MGFLGRAGTNITSIFLVLMVKPNLSQAVENPSISSCISCSLLAFNAQSSAKTRYLITVSLTLLTACRRRGLNSFPSHLYLMGMPVEESSKASISIAENNKLNSVGARTQPCFTPLITGNGSEAFPSSRIVKLSDDLHEPLRTTKLRHDLPQSLSAHGIECFCDVYECYV